MALTFSPQTTARIIQIFRVLNNPRTVVITASMQIILAGGFLLKGWDWLAWSTLLCGVVDATRVVFLVWQKRSRRRAAHKSVVRRSDTRSSGQDDAAETPEGRAKQPRRLYLFHP